MDDTEEEEALLEPEPDPDPSPEVSRDDSKVDSQNCPAGGDRQKDPLWLWRSNSITTILPLLDTNKTSKHYNE